MAGAPEPSCDEHRWTIAVARSIVFGMRTRIQAPSNLAAGPLARLLDAGIDDWGGVSPVTADHVSPKAPWPRVDWLAEEAACSGKVLVERLPVHPPWLADPERWLDPALRTRALQLSDADGYARQGLWAPGRSAPPSSSLCARSASAARRPARVFKRWSRAREGRELGEDEVVVLLRTRLGLRRGLPRRRCAAQIARARGARTAARAARSGSRMNANVPA